MIADFSQQLGQLSQVPIHPLHHRIPIPLQFLKEPLVEVAAESGTAKPEIEQRALQHGGLDALAEELSKQGLDARERQVLFGPRNVARLRPA